MKRQKGMGQLGEGGDEQEEMREGREGEKKGEKKGKGDLAPMCMVISKSRHHVPVD